MTRWVSSSALVFAACSVALAGGRPAPGLKVPAGFVVEEFADQTLANDITHLTIDPAGRVIVSGRGYVRILADDNGDGRADRAIEVLENLKDSPMGVLALDGVLYVVTDGGLQKYTGYTGQGKLTQPPTTLLPVRTSNEHDAHAIRLGPDGALYLMCGNFAGITKSAIMSLASPVKDPVAGVLLRVEPDTKQVGVVADGFRNAYDFDFDLKGEAFTYDSDNERCMSLPWYEPCRFYHIVPGGNYGWTAPQSGNFWRKPPYFLDVIPPVCTLGRGSPTACVCYRHQQFPATYQGEFFLADWTFGRIHFVKREKVGSRYTAKPEIFLEATGDNGFAPTAMAVHPKSGELYVSIGGRGTRGAVYRIRHEAGEADPKPLAITRPANYENPYPERLVAGQALPAIDGTAIQTGTTEQQLLNIRALQLAVGGLTSPTARGTVREGYAFAKNVTRASGDPWCAVFRANFPTKDRLVNLERARMLAALEDATADAVAKVASLLTETSDPIDDVHYLAALSRLSGSRSEADTIRIAAALLALDRKYEASKLTRDSYWPLRIGEAAGELVRWDARLPVALLASMDFGRPEHVLFASLPGVDSPSAARTFLQAASREAEFGWSPGLVAVLGKLPESETHPTLRKLWDRPQLHDSILTQLARNPSVEDRPKFVAGLKSFDPNVVKTAAEALGKLAPPEDNADLVALLRALRRLPNEKAEVFARQAIVARLQARTGQKMTDDIKAWEAWVALAQPEIAAKLNVSEGYDAAAWKKRIASIDWNAGDGANGAKVFVRASCVACHNGPRALGPSLQGVAKRFSKDDLLTTVLEPNRDVSPRYRPTQVLTAEGKTYTGMVIYDATDGVILATAADSTVRVPGPSIESKRILETSIMPAGLLDKLTDAEIADLFAYLRTQ